MDWFRMWHGMPNDDKLRVVARKSKQPMALVVAVWSYLLDYASQQEQRGSVDGIDLEAVAVGLDMEEEAVKSIFFCLEEKERIKNNKIVSWDKLQPKREDRSTERVRAHRNAMKRNETQSNAPDTDTDTDKKKKRLSANADGFDEFWQQYPKKKGKDAARKAWGKISQSIVPEIMVALESHIDQPSWQKDDGKFIPHPASWLNGKRWEDELEVEERQQRPLVVGGYRVI